MVDFSALGRELVLPLPMPLGFVLPPRIAITTTSMCPMVDDPWTAFGDEGSSARGTLATSGRKGFCSNTIDERELHRVTIAF